MFPQGIRLSPGSTDVHRFVRIQCKDNANQLEQGDWVYFYNNQNYPSRHPETDFNNAFQGENAVVVRNNRYEGFGVEETSELQMKRALLDAYNEMPKQWNGADWVDDTQTAQTHGEIMLRDVQG